MAFLQEGEMPFFIEVYYNLAIVLTESLFFSSYIRICKDSRKFILTKVEKLDQLAMLH